MNHNMCIETRDLSVGYRSSTGGRCHEVAHNINFSIMRGEFIALLGPNGAGKSTLLRTLAGFQPLLSGSIIYNNKEFGTYSRQEIASMVSVVLTGRPAMTQTTVRQLVGMGRSPYTGFWGRLRGDDDRKIDSALRMTGVSQLADRLVDTLSDGECQRVMIAKALCQETDVILLDEPTAFLDFPGKVEMMQLLRRLAHEQNKCILLSTHDINLALHTADRLMLMDKAKGFCCDTTDVLCASGPNSSKPVIAEYFCADGITFDCANRQFLI